jgi:hypothetical protein
MEDLSSIPRDPADLLRGMPAIARHLGIKERQARHLQETGALPCFKLGKTVCARRSTLIRWLEDREAAGRQPKP